MVRKYIRKSFAAGAIALLGIPIVCARSVLAQGDARPNILFIISDDVSWAHAGAYGDKVVTTPAFVVSGSSARGLGSTDAEKPSGFRPTSSGFRRLRKAMGMRSCNFSIR